MTIDDVLNECRHLNIENANDISDDFVERTIFMEDLDQWKTVLSGIFGPPLKEAGAEVSDEIFKLTMDYGGLQADQTLYYKRFDNHSMIAMLWPWKDNHQVTLKIARFTEQNGDKERKG